MKRPTMIRQEEQGDSEQNQTNHLFGVEALLLLLELQGRRRVRALRSPRCLRASKNSPIATVTKKTTTAPTAP